MNCIRFKILMREKRLQSLKKPRTFFVNTPGNTFFLFQNEGFTAFLPSKQPPNGHRYKTGLNEKSIGRVAPKVGCCPFSKNNLSQSIGVSRMADAAIVYSHLLFGMRLEDLFPVGTNQQRHPDSPQIEAFAKWV